MKYINNKSHSAWHITNRNQNKTSHDGDKFRLNNNFYLRFPYHATGYGIIIAACLTAVPAMAAPPSISLVSACSGVSLPRSVVTGILSPVLTGIVSPIQGAVNPLLGILIPPLNINVTGLLTSAASGAPIPLQVLDTNGNIVGPASQCNTATDSIQLNTPKGISIGGNRITGLGTVGQDASAGELGSIAFGNNATTAVAATNAVALGSGASVTVANSVALGAGSTATRGALAGYTAPGLTGTQTSAGEVSVGAPGALRQITNVAPGSQPTDAVNLAQVTTAIGATAAAAPLQYSTAAAPTIPSPAVPSNDVTLVGTAAGTPVKLHNVAAGAVTAISTDAVNGAQLFATNAQVTSNTTSIANNTTNITNLTNGTAGLVQQVGGAPGNGAIAVGAATGGTSIIVSGTSGNRTISGVAAGIAGTDAVNVSQLNGVAAQSVNAVLYDTLAGSRLNSVTLGGGATGPVSINNVATAALNATSTQAVNGSQLNATNNQVAANTTNITANTMAITNNTTAITANIAATTNLTTNINNGTIGLVQQTGGSPGNGQITVGATTGGTTVSVNGTAGNRIVTGVAAGLAANDAATVGQLGMVNGGSFNAVQYDTNSAGGRLNSVTLVGGGAGPVQVTNVAAGQVNPSSTDAVNGGQLYVTQSAISSLAGSVVTYTDSNHADGVTINQGGSAAQIHNVAAGTATNDVVNVGQLNAGMASTLSAASTYTDGRINQVSFNLNQVARRAYAGTAAAIALQPPQIFAPGKISMRVGTGLYRGEVAVGASLRATADNGRWSVSGGISGGADAGVAGSAGVDFVLGQ